MEKTKDKKIEQAAQVVELVLEEEIVEEELLEIMVEEDSEQVPTMSAHHSTIEPLSGVENAIIQVENNGSQRAVERLYEILGRKRGDQEDEIVSDTPSPSNNQETLFIEDVISEPEVVVQGLIENLTSTPMDDLIVGNALNNIIYSQEGNDVIYGQGGADTFVIELDELGLVDTIMDFSVAEGDALDISELLFLFDPVFEIIEDYINVNEVAGDSVVEIDVVGFGGYSPQVVFEGVTGLDPVADLVSDGVFII